jgi:hypothetical protein
VLSSEQISKQNRAGATDEAAWEEKLAQLAAYKAAHGDCNVPKGWAEDPRLANWVKTQRVHKKALGRGEPSRGMTAARAARLEALGLAWEDARGTANEAAWEAQLVRLAAYKATHGDCNVLQAWAEDPRLGKWVHKQRGLKRRLDRGDPSEGMTVERAARLEALGFVCNLV